MPVAMGMRHGVEQPGVVHHDEQPLRQDLAVGAPELGHVGVDRQLLARDHQVGVGDRRLDDRPPVDGVAPSTRAGLWRNGSTPSMCASVP